MSRRIVFEEGVAPGLASALADPERLLADPAARPVKDHVRTAVSAVDVGGRTVYVKRFKPYAWYRRLEAALLGSQARRAWRAAAELERAGFAVPPRLALVETADFGLGGDSYLVSAAVAGAESGVLFWRGLTGASAGRERRRVVGEAARFLRRFHDAGFYSKDANAGNFLVRSPEAGGIEIFALDLENVRRMRSVSRRRRLKNLVQLYRPLRTEVRRLDRVRFVSAYLSGAGDAARREEARRAETSRWLADLAELDRRKEREYRARGSAASRRARSSVTPA
ncbi:MAG: hypothetical protein QOD06_2983 [Candidatus Binatota bacterium]|nr:hypothetical protein [Candidatus Binatota bacterium]